MKYIPLAARICLSSIFLKAGINHTLGFSGFQQAIAGAGLPFASLLAVGTIIFLLTGSLSLLLGYKIRIGATLLILFLIPATLVFHNFLVDLNETNNFLKNLGLMGGLLMLIHAGTGAVSLDLALTPSSTPPGRPGQTLP
ncbi:MAG: DoxX family protein [Cyanothece sp. SIO1E1]|nr:DoxX family protein [Cyanothece sp. SIO1E1]